MNLGKYCVVSFRNYYSSSRELRGGRAERISFIFFSLYFKLYLDQLRKSKINLGVLYERKDA